MLKSDTLQASLKAAAVGGIFMLWVNFTIEAFKFAWHIVSTSSEKETWKASFKATSPEKETCKASFKAVSEKCQELYDDDEYHLIHSTHLCEAFRGIEKMIFSIYHV